MKFSLYLNRRVFVMLIWNNIIQKLIVNILRWRLQCYLWIFGEYLSFFGQTWKYFTDFNFCLPRPTAKFREYWAMRKFSKILYISNFRSQMTYSFVKYCCFIYFFLSFFKSDMSRYGNLEVFKRVPWNWR